MRNILMLLVAAGSIFYADAASAQHRRHDHYHHHGGGHGGGGGWVAPLIGGMVVGGVLGAIINEPRYSAPPAYRTECRIVPAYDRYGYYVGDRRECYSVPNY